MRKIIKTYHKPVHDYKHVCDFTGKDACVELELEGGYGSDLDGQKYVFDFSNESAAEVLKFIESKLKETELKNHLHEVSLWSDIG